MREIRPFSQTALKEVYHQYLSRDFPDNERRPLEALLLLMSQGRYEAYGLYQDNELCGYALIYGEGDIYLLDYFAIIASYRHQHLGTHFLNLLMKQYQDKTLFLESEDPDSNPDEIKTRRIRFYLRSGLAIQKTRLYLYYVDYVILANRTIDQKTLEDFYHGLYPDRFYQQFITFKPN